MEPVQKTHFTEDEYLALERVSPTKHEFIDGQIISVAGTLHQSLIAANTGGALGAALRDKPFAVLNSDVAVHVAAMGSYFFPDVSVVCGPAAPAPKHPGAIENPVLLVEVLSLSTLRYDLGAKFSHYRRLQSLQDFIAVRKDERRVEHWHRADVGRWIACEVEEEGSVELPGFGVTLALAEIYEKLELFPE